MAMQEKVVVKTENIKTEVSTKGLELKEEKDQNFIIKA